MRKLTVTLELDEGEAIALRELACRLLSRTIEETLTTRPADEIKAADEARNKLSLAIYLALQES
jgi:hypothetical protein